MARQYAGILASLGMTLVLVRALRTGSGFESAVVSALFWMFALGVVGFMTGSVAQATVDESVRQQIEQELAARETPSPSG